ncbi:alanine--tRNA ligase [Spirochaetota bacterium]
MLKTQDLRNSFIDFFRERDHRTVPSSSLVPKDDATLLFTTAGMVQFKPMFAGTVDLEYARAASVQKCLRTSDLELVGRTKRHLTFFEMLGNFSFGDYFKSEAIEYAWDYSTNIIKFPKEKIWISIFKDDDEAYDIWNKHIGIAPEKIVRLGKKDNFWGPAGDTGACGPCSELYLDRGEEFGCGSKNCAPGCDCERFLEYWNLVFNQFNQDTNGNLTPLPKTGIDTGMGLERLAVLVQDVDSVFETDELQSLVDFVSEQSGVKYEGDNTDPIRIIVEHSRALTFAISDGIYPSNEGRGYVLRRILRRALRYSRQIGQREPFVYKVIEPVVNMMKDFYPEVEGAIKNITNIIMSEEKRFLETLENGMDRLEEIIKTQKKNKEKIISGKDAFVLYDTFGFPVELTLEIAQERELDVSIDDFHSEMDKQRERGKKSWKGSENGNENTFEEIAREAGSTLFKGYEDTVNKSKIILLSDTEKNVKSLGINESGFIVIKETPFYGESGGQVGDIGEIVTKGGDRFIVNDTKKYNNTTIHVGEVVKGKFKKGDEVTARVDIVNRNLIKANHTATHLLQAALVKILGDHVKQSGSLVEPDRLRFDFSHFNAMKNEEIQEVENIVNTKIWENVDVDTKIMKADEAIKAGATAVFDEKYDETVRVVSVDNYSNELCGGTHVNNTGQIGVFKILKESSPGAGMRRIEALTLKGVLERLNKYDRIVSELAETMNVDEDNIINRVNDVALQAKSNEKELVKLKKKNISSNIDSIMNGAGEVNSIKIIPYIFDKADVDQLREISDSIRSSEQNSVVIFGSDNNGKALLLFAATKNAVKNGIDCGKIIKDAVKIVDGKGGGRKDMAQAGGNNPELLDKAIERASELAGEMLGK